MDATLALLEELTPAWSEKRVGTSRTLLPYLREMPEGYEPLPAGGYAENWHFAVAQSFNAALDVTLMRRERVTRETYWDEQEKKEKRRKQTYYVWIQGAAFDFLEGYTLHSRDGKRIVQVLEAQPAEPATYSIMMTWPRRPADLEERIREMETSKTKGVYRYSEKAKAETRHQLLFCRKRYPGFIRLQTYMPGSVPATWEKDQYLTMTQDQLVRFLITGDAGVSKAD